MGGLISILQASERPDTVAGLVLVDPALPIALDARPDPRVFATFAAFLVPAVGPSSALTAARHHVGRGGRPRDAPAVLRRPVAGARGRRGAAPRARRTAP